MKFSTPVDLPEKTVQITPHSRVMFIGSCFADHIGGRMSDCLPQEQVCINPHGTLYNPVSIRNTLVTYLPDTIDPPYSRKGLFETSDGQWRHWDYSTKFSAPTQQALEAELTQGWERANALFAQLDVLFITLSTDHVYWITDGPYKDYCAANCHKQPASMFKEEVLPWRDLESWWHYFLSHLLQVMPHLRVVFTISPYRYAKYGMHGNALSKAQLLLLTDHLCREFERAYYFPAYEIVTDELRDYRFYAPDMLHPSEQAIDYVWERFTEWAFTPTMHDYARERTALLRAMGHRPINPDTEAHRNFLQKLDMRKQAFRQKWGTDALIG